MQRAVRAVLVAMTAVALAACGGGTPSPAASIAGPAGSSGAAPCAPSNAAGSVAATVKDFAFAPEPVQAKVGDTVTWTNAGPTPHSAALDSFAVCATTTLNTGDAGSITFTAAGTYTYHCAIHPTRMKGTIVVSA